MGEVSGKYVSQCKTRKCGRGKVSAFTGPSDEHFPKKNTPSVADSAWITRENPAMTVNFPQCSRMSERMRGPEKG